MCVYIHISACRDVLTNLNSIPEYKAFAFFSPPSLLECKLQGAIEPQAYLAMLLISGRDPSRLMWSSPIHGSVIGTV